MGDSTTIRSQGEQRGGGVYKLTGLSYRWKIYCNLLHESTEFFSRLPTISCSYNISFYAITNCFFINKCIYIYIKKLPIYCHYFIRKKYFQRQ